MNLNRFYWMQIYFLKYQIFFIKCKCLLLNTNVILLLNINKYLLNVKYFWLNVNIKIRFCYKQGSSLILRVTHERHECDTKEKSGCDMSDTSLTRVLHERHECDQSEKFWYRRVNIFFTPLYLLYGKWMITRRGTISF